MDLGRAIRSLLRPRPYSALGPATPRQPRAASLGVADWSPASEGPPVEPPPVEWPYLEHGICRDAEPVLGWDLPLVLYLPGAVTTHLSGPGVELSVGRYDHIWGRASELPGAPCTASAVGVQYIDTLPSSDSEAGTVSTRYVTAGPRQAEGIWTGEARTMDAALRGAGRTWADVLPGGWEADPMSIGIGHSPTWRWYVFRIARSVGIQACRLGIPAGLKCLEERWLAGDLTPGESAVIQAQLMAAMVPIGEPWEVMAPTYWPHYYDGQTIAHGWQWTWQPGAGYVLGFTRTFVQRMYDGPDEDQLGYESKTATLTLCWWAPVGQPDTISWHRTNDTPPEYVEDEAQFFATTKFVGGAGWFGPWSGAREGGGGVLRVHGTRIDTGVAAAGQPGMTWYSYTAQGQGVLRLTQGPPQPSSTEVVPNPGFPTFHGAGDIGTGGTGGTTSHAAHDGMWSLGSLHTTERPRTAETLNTYAATAGAAETVTFKQANGGEYHRIVGSTTGHMCNRGANTGATMSVLFGRVTKSTFRQTNHSLGSGGAGASILVGDTGVVLATDQTWGSYWESEGAASPEGRYMRQLDTPCDGSPRYGAASPSHASVGGLMGLNSSGVITHQAGSTMPDSGYAIPGDPGWPMDPPITEQPPGRDRKAVIVGSDGVVRTLPEAQAADWAAIASRGPGTESVAAPQLYASPHGVVIWSPTFGDLECTDSTLGAAGHPLLAEGFGYQYLGGV